MLLGDYLRLRYRLRYQSCIVLQKGVYSGYIEQRLVVRLFNVVRQFEVTDKLIIFYVPEQNQQDFVKWLNAIDICKIFAAYNREIKIRVSR